MGSCERLHVLLLIVLITPVTSVARMNAWGWWYNNGAPISYERRVNIISQMLVTRHACALPFVSVH